MEDPLARDDLGPAGRLPGRSFDVLRVVALAGDLAVFLIFAFIGRSSHHVAASDAPLRVAGTAAPFMGGWLIGAWAFGAYKRKTLKANRGLMVTLVSWLLGAGIGLAIRSALERRIVPLSFILVTFLFNLALLLIWRGFLRVASGRIGI